MLTDRQRLIFSAFLENPTQALSSGDLGIDAGRTALFRDLRKMVDLELLTLEGKKYSLNRESLAYLEWDLTRPPYERQQVRYDRSLLEGYTPNKSSLLSDMQLTELGALPAIESSADSKSYERILSSMMIDLTHASSNLENVNISWLDTKTLIEFGEKPNGLTENQLAIVLNHKAAISHLVKHKDDMSVSKRDLFDLHKLLMSNLLRDQSAEGRLRTRVVGFEDSRYLPPDMPQLLREQFELFCSKASLIDNPYEQAFFTMLFVSYLQPFEDGNKRTSRVATNIPLIKARLAPFSFAEIKRRDYMFGLLAFYERGRHDFMASQFVRACKASADRYSKLLEFVSEGGMLNSVTGGGDAGSKERKRSRKP